MDDQCFQCTALRHELETKTADFKSNALYLKKHAMKANDLIAQMEKARREKEQLERVLEERSLYLSNIESESQRYQEELKKVYIILDPLKSDYETYKNRATDLQRKLDIAEGQNASYAQKLEAECKNVMQWQTMAEQNDKKNQALTGQLKELIGRHRNMCENLQELAKKNEKYEAELEELRSARRLHNKVVNELHLRIKRFMNFAERLGACLDSHGLLQRTERALLARFNSSTTALLRGGVNGGINQERRLRSRSSGGDKELINENEFENENGEQEEGDSDDVDLDLIAQELENALEEKTTPDEYEMGKKTTPDDVDPTMTIPTNNITTSVANKKTAINGEKESKSKAISEMITRAEGALQSGAANVSSDAVKAALKQAESFGRKQRISLMQQKKDATKPKETLENAMPSTSTAAMPKDTELISSTNNGPESLQPRRITRTYSRATRKPDQDKSEADKVTNTKHQTSPKQLQRLSSFEDEIDRSLLSAVKTSPGTSHVASNNNSTTTISSHDECASVNNANKIDSVSIPRREENQRPVFPTSESRLPSLVQTSVPPPLSPLRSQSGPLPSQDSHFRSAASPLPPIDGSLSSRDGPLASQDAPLHSQDKPSASQPCPTVLQLPTSPSQEDILLQSKASIPLHAVPVLTAPELEQEQLTEDEEREEFCTSPAALCIDFEESELESISEAQPVPKNAVSMPSSGSLTEEFGCVPKNDQPGQHYLMPTSMPCTSKNLLFVNDTKIEPVLNFRKWRDVYGPFLAPPLSPILPSAKELSLVAGPGKRKYPFGAVSKPVLPVSSQRVLRNRVAHVPRGALENDATCQRKKARPIRPGQKTNF